MQQLHQNTTIALVYAMDSAGRKHRFALSQIEMLKHFNIHINEPSTDAIFVNLIGTHDTFDSIRYFIRPCNTIDPIVIDFFSQSNEIDDKHKPHKYNLRTLFNWNFMYDCRNLGLTIVTSRLRHAILTSRPDYTWVKPEQVIQTELASFPTDATLPIYLIRQILSARDLSAGFCAAIEQYLAPHIKYTIEQYARNIINILDVNSIAGTVEQLKPQIYKDLSKYILIDRNYNHFLNQQINTVIVVRCDDVDAPFAYDVKDNRIDNATFPSKSTLAWLAKTQGVTCQTLNHTMNPTNTSHPSDPFLQSIQTAYFETETNACATAFLVRMTLLELIVIEHLIRIHNPKNNAKNHGGIINLSSMTPAGLINMSTDITMYNTKFNIHPPKQIRVPIDHVYQIQPVDLMFGNGLPNSDKYLPETAKSFGSIENIVLTESIRKKLIQVCKQDDNLLSRQICIPSSIRR